MVMKMGPERDGETARALEEVIKLAYLVSEDVGDEIESILREGRERPLNREEARQLFTLVIDRLRAGAARRGDAKTTAALQGDINAIVERVLEVRERVSAQDVGQQLSMLTAGSTAQSTEFSPPTNDVKLESRDGVNVGPVFPIPCFHGMSVPMRRGFVKTADIKLWGGNERLDIHLSQFEQKNGRPPTHEDLLAILRSKMDLPGIPNDRQSDQFEITELARSIAANGVRVPPVLDKDGTLIDGNRRIAASLAILNSSDFEPEEKKRVEYTLVWQISEYADPNQRDAVIISLNFEPACKMDWPVYVKARKVYEEWQAMLALEPRLPNNTRQAQLKRQLSQRFALGPETSVVNRYLRMVTWANDFETYHIQEKKRDQYEVKHTADRYFEYFDELSKGVQPGGVAHSLQQDDGFRKMVFDLLYDGKFANWRQIRELKLVFDNEEAREALGRARSEKDRDLAEDHLENAMAVARSARAEMREVGANSRIDAFVKWIEQLPVKTFRDIVSADNLKRLLKALTLVSGYANQVLAEPKGGNA